MIVPLSSGNDCLVGIEAQKGGRIAFGIGFKRDPTVADIEEIDHFLREHILPHDAMVTAMFREDDRDKRATLARAIVDGAMEKN